MSIHKVTNTFVGNGSALETSVSTLTPGKLGVFKADQTALGAATPYIGGTASDNIQFSETFADGSFKKSMVVKGLSMVSAKSEVYKPATREVWAIGYDRKLATGSIEVVDSTQYSFNIRFKNDKSLYSERPEILRGDFVSSASTSQLLIATQIAGIVNNGGFRTEIVAIVVGNGTGVYGLTNATNYGVEITAKDINQFRSSTYKEDRVYFSVFVDDATGFGATTTCTQIQANSPGEGTYNYVYNKENFDYQYEGLSNRRVFPVQTPLFNVSSTAVLSAAITPTVTANISEDTVTFSASVAAILRVGELVELDGVNYEIKYFISATVAVLTEVLSAALAADAAKVRCFYSMIVLTFADRAFTSGPDLINQAQKSIYICTPAIDAGATWTTSAAALTAGSTEGAALITNLGAWLATTPINVNAATLAF